MSTPSTPFPTRPEAPQIDAAAEQRIRQVYAPTGNRGDNNSPRAGRAGKDGMPSLAGAVAVLVIGIALLVVIAPLTLASGFIAMGLNMSSYSTTALYSNSSTVWVGEADNVMVFPFDDDDTWFEVVNRGCVMYSGTSTVELQPRRGYMEATGLTEDQYYLECSMASPYDMFMVLDSSSVSGIVVGLVVGVILGIVGLVVVIVGIVLVVKRTEQRGRYRAQLVWAPVEGSQPVNGQPGGTMLGGN